MNDGVSVRWAKVSDAAELAEVHVASWRAAYRGLLPDDRLASLDVGRRAEQWRGWLGPDGERNATLVAELDGEIAGFATLEMPSRDEDQPEDVAQIPALYLRPERRRAGIGTVLVDAAMQELRARGFREVILWMLEGNDRARAFYERTGWHLDGSARRASQYFPELDDLVEVRFRRLL
jgi:GNAT superfamily N-acetyltransferase